MADGNDCLAAIDAANRGRLDDEAVSAVVAEMQRAQRSAQGLDGLDRAMFDAAEQLSEQAELAARIETNRYGRSLLDTLAGPTLGTISDVDGIRAKVMAGEDVWAEVLRTGQANMPFANLFYSKAALDYLFLYQLQEMANPGYLRRMERRMKRENNQEFFFPPSQAAR